MKAEIQFLQHGMTVWLRTSSVFSFQRLIIPFYTLRFGCELCLCRELPTETDSRFIVLMFQTTETWIYQRVNTN